MAALGQNYAGRGKGKREGEDPDSLPPQALRVHTAVKDGNSFLPILYWESQDPPSSYELITTLLDPNLLLEEQDRELEGLGSGGMGEAEGRVRPGPSPGVWVRACVKDWRGPSLGGERTEQPSVAGTECVIVQCSREQLRDWTGPQLGLRASWTQPQRSSMQGPAQSLGL